MRTLLNLLALITVASSAPAALYTYDFSSGFANGGVLTDGNPAGWSDTRSVSGISDFAITDLNVRLSLSGGYNGDLYGYLVYQATPTGPATTVQLLNRVGLGAGTPGSETYLFGFSTAGFANITLDDEGTSGNIHHVASPTSGAGIAYTPDGGSLAMFNGLNPNGTWTLFFADLGAGDQSTLTAWSLDIAAVPEPVDVALCVSGILAAGGISWKRWRRFVLS